MTFVIGLLAVYFVVWWICFIAVLPFGVRSQHEDGEIVPGSEAGAPIAPNLLKKALAASLIAAAIVALFTYLIRSGLLTLDSLPVLKAPPSL